MSKSNKNKDIGVNSSEMGAMTYQYPIFHIEKSAEIDGIEMGVLDSGAKNKETNIRRYINLS